MASLDLLSVRKPMTGMDAAMSMVGNDVQQAPIVLPPNNPSSESYIDVNQISTATPEGYVPSEYEKEMIKSLNAQYAPRETGVLGQASLYPGLSHNINVGGYSGSIIGSGNIYVPGGDIMAIDPILARRKAIDDAAKLRAAELIKPFEYQKPKAFKDPRYQAKMDKAVFDFQDEMIKRAKDQYGQNWRAMIKDQSTELGSKMVRGLNNFETIISNTDAITDMVATIDNGLKDKTIFLTPEQAKIYNEYKSMIGNFEDYDKLTRSDFETLHSKLVGARDFNDYLNKSGVLDKLQAEISSSFGVNDKGEYYRLSTNEKTSYKDIINDLTKSLVETTFSNEIRNGIYSESQIKEAIAARLKDQVKRTGSIQQKNESAIGRGEAEDVQEFSASRNEYREGAEKSKDYYSYDPTTGKRGVLYSIKSREDYNISLYNPKPVTINERDAQNKIRTQSFNGFTMDGLEVKTSNGYKNIPGNSLVKIGTISRTADGDLVADATVAVPTMTPILDPITGQKIGEEETYTIQQLPLALSKNGQKTGTISKISNKIKDPKKKANFNEGVNQMYKKTTQETQPSAQSSVQSSRTYSQAQEQNIKATMDANPGITRQEAITALEY